jgi:phospholipid/cholesterol/gamma-HCH transport system substrate-binding protein
VKPFRERNPVAVGAVSIAVILLLLLAAFKASDLPLIGGGTTYYANFADASGLKSGDAVRIAGVRVGKVTGIDLEGNHVRVAFQIKTDSKFGATTHADIKVGTLLGAMFLALVPDGPGQLSDGATIPQSRTASAYTVVDAFSGLAQRFYQGPNGDTSVGDINLNQLKTALNSLADATANTPASFKAALQGVSALSTTLASRDAQLHSLLANLQSVTTTLGTRSSAIVDVMKQGNVLLQALVQRREAIHALLVSTSDLGAQLTGLVKQSRADLKPALSNLQGVVNVLLKDQSSLDETLRLMAPFYRYFTNILGVGPWFDTWIMNLPPV